MSLVPYRGPGELSAVGGRVKTEITISLALLKEASVLACKVPCISPIAGLLLYLLQVYDDVRQCKREWQDVVHKLIDIASLVISVGRSCETLGRKDLVHLQTDLEHLQCELERIAGVLKECDEASKLKKIFKRADILSKIQHCDGRLTHALSMLQTKLALRIHYTQLTQGREVQTVRVVSSVAPVKFSSPSTTTNTLTRGDIILLVVLVSISLLYKLFF